MPQKESVHAQSHVEKVDTYAPPRFEPTGVIKPRDQAYQDGDWLGTFNLWLYVRSPEPSMIYQMRSLSKSWEPGKLDVAAGGRYSAGESGLDGLRELEEELGITIPQEHIQPFGRKLQVSLDVHGREQKSVISIYLAEYTGELSDMKLQEDEVAGVVRVPLKPLVEVFRGERDACEGTGLDPHGSAIQYSVTADSFPYNFDDYQRKMAEYIAAKLGVDDAYFGN